MSRRRSLYPATFVTARLTPNGGAARASDVARGVLLRLAQNGGGRRSAAMARSPWCGVGFRQINHSRPSLGARPPSSAPAGFLRLESGPIRRQVHRPVPVMAWPQSPGPLPGDRVSGPKPAPRQNEDNELRTPNLAKQARLPRGAYRLPRVMAGYHRCWPVALGCWPVARECLLVAFMCSLASGPSGAGQSAPPGSAMRGRTLTRGTGSVGPPLRRRSSAAGAMPGGADRPVGPPLRRGSPRQPGWCPAARTCPGYDMAVSFRRYDISVS
jgi:hypothetical protein